MPRHFPAILAAALSLLFCHCAQVVPLTGGERDRTPPVLVEASPPSGTTSFTSGEILLRFDEYVQLRDLSRQLILSPRMAVLPEVTAEGRTVRVRLDKKELRPGTTYRLDFGKAVADMNESNSMPSLTYVFATGPRIDTLTVTGSVNTASNNAPAADAVVGLYQLSDTLSPGEIDSLPFIVPADYTTRSDLSGRFAFNNLPGAAFAVFAITDANRNGLYDPVAERVAFAANRVRAGADSMLQLRLFAEEPSRLFIRRSFSGSPGMATVIYNKEADFSVNTVYGPDNRHIYEIGQGSTKDTILILYRNISDTLALRIRRETDGSEDTVNIPLPTVRAGKRKPHPVMSTGPGVRFDPSVPLQLTFRHWMDTSRIDPARLLLHSADDSLIGSRSWRLKWKNVHTLLLTGDWHRGSTYTVKIDTGLVYDYDGITNDSLKFSFTISGPGDVSTLSLNILVDRKQAYVAQLLNEKDLVVAQRGFAVSLSSPNRVPVRFEGLAPGGYRLKLIYDDNANGRWDTGDLLKRSQPESVFIAPKLFKLLADWEVEEEVEVK